MLSEEVSQEKSGEWTDAEITTFNSRLAVLKKGMNDMDAEKLAEQMLYRDRPDSGDDRRVCLECTGLKKGVCARPQSAGLMPGLTQLITVLQRCDGFAMKGAA